MSASSRGAPAPPEVAAPAHLDLRLVPTAAATWAAMWLVIQAAVGLRLVTLAAGLLGVIALRWRSAALGLVAVALTVTALVGGLRLWVLTTGPVPELAAAGAVVQAELVVDSTVLAGASETAVVRGTLLSYIGRGTAYQTRVGVLLFGVGASVDDWLDLPPGTRVAVTARLRPADRTDAAAATLRPLTKPQIIAPATGWRLAVEHVRQRLRAAVAGARPEQAALVPALVVGDTTTMPPTLKEDFKTTGLTHLTAVSGANLTILLAFLLGLARAVGVRGHWLDLIAIVGVIAFVALCHSEPSVVRAAAMGLVGLAALGHTAIPGQGLRHLCVAVVALCWIDPFLSHSIGFALSALACGGILIWGRPWTAALARWLPRWLAEAVAVTLAAQLATQPLVSWLSGAVSLAGLLANVLAGPWVGPATVAGLVTALVASVTPTVGAWVGWVGAWLVEPILQVGHRCARLPGASHPWPATPLGLIILTLACLFGAWVIPRLFRRVWLTLLVAVALAASLLHAPLQPGWPPSDWAIVACDVGQGDAVVVRVGAGQALLLDTGPPDADLAVCLRGLGIRQVPMVILSHYHADHAGGLPELLAGWPVGLLLVNQTAAPGAASALALAEAHGTTVMVAQTGQWFTLGEATVEVVSPAPRTLPAANGAEDSSAENDLSLVVRVEVAGVSLLATGDLETAGQQALVRRGVGLGVDILKVPHHGSARQDDDFLAATGARIALISVGQNNSYGHPAASTITRLQRLGMTIARTDEHGSAAVWRQDNDLAIVTQR